MPRLNHGANITTGEMQASAAQLSEVSKGVPFVFTLVQPVHLDRFGFLFPALQAEPANLLAQDSSTVSALVALGRSMLDPSPGDPADPGDSEIPAAYTYFGQFIDHDITLEALSAPLPELLDPKLTPMSVPDIRGTLRNVRSATLDLDNLYSPPAPRDPADGNRMLVGPVASTGSSDPPLARPPGKGDDNDVPREPPSEDPSHDRAALIGDPRDDENTIIAQLQVAFLKAHNALVAEGNNFNEAQRLLRQHYQHLVVHDYLRRVCDPAVVEDILENGPLPETWIVEWEHLVDAGGPFDRARRFDTKLVEFLFELRNVKGETEADDGARLAVRNLLRGYLLRMPTGQAVATALGLPVLSPQELEAAAASPEQVQALQDGGFLDRTPLWYYILAEASAGGGQHLGPVGSTLVADVMIGLVRRSDDSILSLADWRPSLPSAVPGTFELRDLLAFAGVLPGVDTSPPPGPRTYVVEPGDTLSGIAESELGDANRWPQIFALNRARITDPDLIFPGQVLALPDRDSTDPVPQIPCVVAGDTLSASPAPGWATDRKSVV